MLYNDEIVIAIYSHEGLVLCWSVLLENEKGKHHSEWTIDDSQWTFMISTSFWATMKRKFWYILKKRFFSRFLPEIWCLYPMRDSLKIYKIDVLWEIVACLLFENWSSVLSKIIVKKRNTFVIHCVWISIQWCHKQNFNVGA